jgi:hypothetical protein
MSMGAPRDLNTEMNLLPLILVEDGHSKNSNDPGDKRNNHDADDDSQTATRNGREYLTPNNAINHAITNHDDNI